MDKLTKAKQAEKNRAMEYLREAAPIGSTLYTIVTHVAASGMSRSIRVLTIRDNAPRDVSYLAAKVLDYRLDEKNGGLRVGGAGMDMGFHVVNSLSYALHGFEKKRCAEHANSDAPSVSGRSCGTAECFEPGYTLTHRWI